ELRRHRDFLNNIINAVPDPLYVSDQQQHLVIANDSYCSLFDVDRHRIVGRNIAEVLPDSGGIPQPISAEPVTAIAGSTDEERIQRHSDGMVRVHSIRRSAFHDAVTGAAYVVGISRDITEERRHQKRLSLLASVFNNAAEGVAILTRDGRIVEANPRLMEMFGCDLLVGRCLANVIDLSITDLANELVRVSHGTPWAGKIAATLPSGEEHWY
ncbi:MAG: PAS domain-containing protein, partial [Planctomycetaceae bacterium]|nr:PAS domain-containing protein [Planctomycetaceae bacterium]